MSDGTSKKPNDGGSNTDRVTDRPASKSADTKNDQSQVLAGAGKISPGWWDAVRDTIYTGLAATGIWVFGEHLAGHGHPYTASVANFFACITFLASAPIYIVKSWGHPWKTWISFFFLTIVIGLVFFTTSKVVQPHLRLILNGARASRLDLTNDFLFPKINSQLDSTKLEALLFIPAVSQTSNATLRLSVVNDSLAIAEAVAVTILIPTNLLCTPEPLEIGGAKWQNLGTPLNWSGFEETEIRSPLILYSRGMTVFPDVHLLRLGGWTRDPFPLIAVLRAKDMDPVILVFWTICVQGSESYPPRLIQKKEFVITNQSGGVQNFQISWEKLHWFTNGVP
jgi:hypothetical protein